MMILPNIQTMFLDILKLVEMALLKNEKLRDSNLFVLRKVSAYVALPPRPDLSQRTKWSVTQ